MDLDKASKLSTIGAFVLGAIVLYFTVWPPHQAPQTSPAPHEANGMTTNWILPSALGLCILLAAFLNFAAVYISNRGTRKSSNKNLSTPNVMSEQLQKLGRENAELKTDNAALKTFKEQNYWLSELAERDKNNVGRYVYVFFSNIKYGGLTELDPYLEIHFDIINASVYNISIDKTIQDGAVYFNNLKLNPKQTEILGSLQYISRDDRGEQRQLIIQQWLAKDVAERIRNPKPDDKLHFRLTIYVRGADNTQGIREQRLSLPPSVPLAPPLTP